MMRSLSLWTAIACAALFVTTQTECAPSDVIIADLPPGDAGERPQHSEPCASASDCDADEYCEKSSCGDSFGKCKHRSTLCDSDAEPVCGCNGVTYWNDCLRRASGIESKVAGECEDGSSCDDATACPDSTASCALLAAAPDQCPRTTSGTCWVLPSVCPTDLTSGGAWKTCGPPPDTCGGLCDAIRAESPHVRLPEPKCPPAPPTAPDKGP